EDRNPSRLRRVPCDLHLREHLRDPVDRALDPRRDLLQLPSVLHRPAEARRYRRSRRALQAPRRQALRHL
ncbi:MAG: LSU ribosomal protein L31p @ LSU ribosomal protein L31p, zinc-dependent, partial [uncultured Solirubrobacteraceae bacterium]